MVSELAPGVEALIEVDVRRADHLAVSREPNVIRVRDAGRAAEVDAFPGMGVDVSLGDGRLGLNGEHAATEGKERHDLRFLAEEHLMRGNSGVGGTSGAIEYLDRLSDGLWPEPGGSVCGDHERARAAHDCADCALGHPVELVDVWRACGMIDGLVSKILYHVVRKELAGVVGAQSAHHPGRF